MQDIWLITFYVPNLTHKNINAFAWRDKKKCKIYHIHIRI